MWPLPLLFFHVCLFAEAGGTQRVLEGAKAATKFYQSQKGLDFN